MRIAKPIVAVLVSTIWISLSEFFRNEFLFKSLWVDHYQKLGLVFPDKPWNGMVWGLWALCFSTCILMVVKKLAFFPSIVLTWLFGFVLMWLVIWNLGVLPMSLLFYAVPLSLLEVALSVFLIRKIAN